MSTETAPNHTPRIELSVKGTSSGDESTKWTKEAWDTARVILKPCSYAVATICAVLVFAFVFTKGIDGATERFTNLWCKNAQELQARITDLEGVVAAQERILKGYRDMETVAEQLKPLLDDWQKQLLQHQSETAARSSASVQAAVSSLQTMPSMADGVLAYIDYEQVSKEVDLHAKSNGVSLDVRERALTAMGVLVAKGLETVTSVNNLMTSILDAKGHGECKYAVEEGTTYMAKHFGAHLQTATAICGYFSNRTTYQPIVHPTPTCTPAAEQPGMSPALQKLLGFSGLDVPNVADIPTHKVWESVKTWMYEHRADAVCLAIIVVSGVLIGSSLSFKILLLLSVAVSTICVAIHFGLAPDSPVHVLTISVVHIPVDHLMWTLFGVAMVLVGRRWRRPPSGKALSVLPVQTETATPAATVDSSRSLAPCDSVDPTPQPLRYQQQHEQEGVPNVDSHGRVVLSDEARQRIREVTNRAFGF